MKYKLASESCIIEFAFVEFIRYCQKFFQNDFTNLYLSIGIWASSGSWWWTRKPGVLQSVGSQSRTWLSDWTELDIYIYTYTHIFFIHSFVDGYLGCFHVHVHFQAIVNSAVMNIGVHVSFWTMVELNTLTPKFWLLTLMFIYNISVKKVNTKKNYRTKWWKLAEGNRQLLLLLILSQLSVGSSPS